MPARTATQIASQGRAALRAGQIGPAVAPPGIGGSIQIMVAVMPFASLDLIQSCSTYVPGASHNGE
jgi:hypothetical protein